MHIPPIPAVDSSDEELARLIHDEARRQYRELWEACRRRQEEMERERQTLAEQALAVERLRQECAGRTPGGAAAGTAAPA